MRLPKLEARKVVSFIAHLFFYCVTTTLLAIAIEAFVRSTIVSNALGIVVIATTGLMFMWGYDNRSRRLATELLFTTLLTQTFAVISGSSWDFSQWFTGGWLGSGVSMIFIILVAWAFFFASYLLRDKSRDW